MVKDHSDPPRGIDPTTHHAMSGHFTTELHLASGLVPDILTLNRHLHLQCFATHGYYGIIGITYPAMLNIYTLLSTF